MENEDPVLRWIGNFGKWQAKRIAVAQFSGFLTAWQTLSMSFLMPSEVPYWCSQVNLVNVDSNNQTDHCRANCTSWEYSRDIYPKTVISQFNLV